MRLSAEQIDRDRPLRDDLQKRDGERPCGQSSQDDDQAHRLISGITACSAANPNTPISRGSRNSAAPPDRSAHQHSDRRARAKNNRPPMPGRRQRGSTSLVDAINHKERTLPPPHQRALNLTAPSADISAGPNFVRRSLGPQHLTKPRTPLAEQVHRVSSHKPATGGAGQTSCHPVKNRGHEAFWIESVKLRTQR